MVSVLEAWRPRGWSDDDRRVLDPLMDTVRRWVAAASPRNVKQTRWMLRCTAGLTVWAYGYFGVSDVRTVLSPGNIEYWTMTVNAHRPTTWRENARWALKAVGRAANPRAWPSPSPQVGRSAIASPYRAAEEMCYLRVAKLPGRRNRTDRHFASAVPPCTWLLVFLGG